MTEAVVRETLLIQALPAKPVTAVEVRRITLRPASRAVHTSTTPRSSA